MVNVECPGCSAPYSVSDRRIPAQGLKMRCPKCGASFLVDKPGGGAPIAPPRPPRATALGNPPPKGARSMGAPAPPPQKKPLFAPRGDDALEVDFALDHEPRGAPARDGVRTERAGSQPVGFGDDDGFGILDIGLPEAGAPARGGARAHPQPGEADLPMPIEADLPMAMEGTEADLPMAAEADLPMALEMDEGWSIDDDLPLAARADLPMPAHDDLPMPAHDDLPMPVHGDLPTALRGPSKRTAGPLAYDDLPLPAQDDLPMFDGDLPMLGDDLPLPVEDDLPIPARHGDLPLPADQDFPLPHRHGDLPLPSDQDFPLPSATGDLPLAGDFDLPEAIGTSGDDVIPLDGDGPGSAHFSADLASEPPRPMPDPVADPPRRPDPVGGEFAVEEDPAAMPAVDAGGEAPRARVRKKRLGAMRVLIVAVPLLAIAGGLLSFTPLGPYGYFAITDSLNADDYGQNLANLRQLAQDELDTDTAAASTSLLARARAEQSAMPRYEPLKAYTAYVAFMTSLRHGSDSEALAVGRQLLDSVPADDHSPLVELARAARMAAEGQLAPARAGAQAANAALGGSDVDALVLAAEIGLRLGAKDAVEPWKGTVQLRKGARTLFGLARAQAATGKPESAVATAKQVLELSKNHVGARLLVAEAALGADPKSDEAVATLESVTQEGPVRAAAARGELVLAHSLLGDAYFARSKLGAAEKAYAQALELDPQSVRALVGNGELFFVAGRHSEALARFEAASRVAADDVHALVGKAKTMIALERAKEARGELEAAVKASKHPLVGFWLGKAQEAMGDFKVAEESYRKAIQVAPTHPDVVYPYVQLADLLSARGAQDQADEILREATDKLPESPRLHLAKGEVALKTGRLDDAKRELTRALALDPDSSVARFHLAVAHRRARELDAARTALDEVAKADPEFPGLTLERGLLYESDGQTDKALEMYQAALQKAPDDVDLKFRVASTLVMSGAADQAVPMLRDVLTKRAQSAEVNHFLGRSLLITGEPPQEALRYLQTAVQYDPNRAEYHLYEAWAANEAGQPAVAESAIDKALALDKNLGDAYWQRAVLLQKRGQTLDALREIEVALARNPSRFEAYATMARCYQDQASYARAEEAWRKALEGNDKMPEWHFRLGKILFDRGARAEAAPHLRKSVDIVEQRKQTPGWLWNANFLLGEALRDSDKERARRAYKEFIRLSTAENAYRRDAERAIEALEGR
jgi:predicted Zn finger-like uncharacterized protein